MRWPALILIALFCSLQYPLWYGKGGYWLVKDATEQLQKAREQNLKSEQRNADLASEVKDLKNGYDAIEERARFELGLVKPGEKFIQVSEPLPPRSSNSR